MRRIHEQRLQFQIQAARAVLRRRRWQLYLFVGAAVVAIAGVGGAAAVAIEALFRR